MTITQLLTASAKNLVHGSAGLASNHGRSEYTRHAPTGDPRLDLARADRNSR